jgi:hypothetical protein
MVAEAQGLIFRAPNHEWSFRIQLRDIILFSLQIHVEPAGLDIGRNRKLLYTFGRNFWKETMEKTRMEMEICSENADQNELGYLRFK